MKRSSSDKDFDGNELSTDWGVPDHITVAKALEVVSAEKDKFFSTVLLLSSHSPFEVPVPNSFKGPTIVDKYKSSVMYSDYALKVFFDQAQTKRWFENTVFIITADHGSTPKAEEPKAAEPPPLTVQAAALDDSNANQRLRLDRLSAPVLASLRWPSRPGLAGGNPAWSYMIQHPHGDFALFVGEMPAEAGPGTGLFGKTLPLRCGSTAPSSRAAWVRWPRRCPPTCAPTMPRGSSSSSTPWPPWPKNARSRCPSRRMASAAGSGRGGGHRSRDPLAL